MARVSQANMQVQIKSNVAQVCHFNSYQRWVYSLFSRSSPGKQMNLQTYALFALAEIWPRSPPGSRISILGQAGA